MKARSKLENRIDQSKLFISPYAGELHCRQRPLLWREQRLLFSFNECGLLPQCIGSKASVHSVFRAVLDICQSVFGMLRKYFFVFANHALMC
jgi:hypothetical protein